MKSLRLNVTVITIVIHSLLFLFFFQLIADFVAAIYAFGLLGLDIPPELACVLLLFAPLIWVFFRQGPTNKGLALLAAVVLLSRAVEIFLDTRGKMFVSGLGVAAFLVYLPAWLQTQRRETFSPIMGISLGLGVMLSIMLRGLGSGVDLSTEAEIITLELALVTGAGLLASITSKGDPGQPASPIRPGRARPGKVIGLSQGITAVFILLYFAFTSPAVIARWTGASYLLIVGVLVLSLAAFIAGLAWKPTLLARAKPGLLLGWNGLFVLFLILTILPQQVHFPPTPASYPLAHSVPPGHEIYLVLMLLLSPVILVDFTLFSGALIAAQPSVRLLGGSFALGSLLLLVMIFAQVFTTVYDYIPVVGPFFRDKFWLVFLASGLLLGLPTLLMRKTGKEQAEGEPSEAMEQKGITRPVTVSLAFTVIMAFAGAWLTAARPAAHAEPASSLRVLTYNIQQGYSRDGQSNLDKQLDEICKVAPDVIGLQETDTARIANGNNDTVRYFAAKLDMYSYYGPSPVVGTFGIALLSRYPLQTPRTYYMYSEGEQTATIAAQIVVAGKTYNVLVTHLGNDGPLVQLEQVLQLAQGKENVLLMGDFNFRPDTAQYRLATSMLAEAWLLHWPAAEASPGFDPAKRIDYLFVTPGMPITAGRYLTGPQSDHPALWVEIEP